MAQLRMINEPGLVEQVQSSLYEAGMISLTEVRDCISNPRIRDFYVRISTHRVFRSPVSVP